MQLLPTIIIVSVLGFFLVISIVVFIFLFLKSRKRKREPQFMSDNNRPTRQLILQSGKVIPVSEALQTASRRDPRSLDLSTMRSGNSLLSRFSRDDIMQTSGATKVLDRRTSSTRDLEAQNEGPESWEAKLRALEERLQKSRSQISTQTGETERRVSASSQKIAASLRKAYKGTPVLETETVDIPSTPGSKSTEIRTIVRKKKSGPQNIAILYPRKSGLKKEPGLYAEVRKGKNPSRSSSRASAFDPVEFAISTNSVQLPPHSFSTNTHTLSSHSKRPRNLTHDSFLSTSTSLASSESLRHGHHATEEVSSPLADTQVSHASLHNSSNCDSTLKPKPIPRPKPKVGRSRSKGVVPKSSRKREVSFIDSATESTTTSPSIQRISMMSNNSIATFASSDISSIWTFGNAQSVTILPSVASNISPALADSQRLQSKYGRYPRAKEKALPIVPRSPLPK